MGTKREKDSSKKDELEIASKKKSKLWAILDTIGVSKPQPRIKVGMRTIKTGLAIALTTLLYALIGRSDQSLFLAMIAAIVAMQGTVETSLRFGMQRLFGTAIGGILGIVFVAIFTYFPLHSNIFVYALSLALVGIVAISICVWLNLRLAATMALVVLLAILINTGNTISYVYALNRALDTAIGVTISIVINLSIRPPKWGSDN